MKMKLFISTLLLLILLAGLIPFTEKPASLQKSEDPGNLPVVVIQTRNTACVKHCHIQNVKEHVVSGKAEKKSGILHSSPQVVGSWFKTRHDSSRQG